MFAISGKNLPVVRSYEDALKVWDESYIHMRFGNGRGLVNKRDTSKRVITFEDGSVAFCFHHTYVVTWQSPTKLSVVCHDSVSSRIFANAFLPPHVALYRQEGKTCVRIDNEFFEGVGNLLTLNLIEGKWTPENPAPQTQLYLNRKKAAAIRKAFKPWIAWRDSITKLQNKDERFFKGYATKDTIASIASLIMSGSQKAYTMDYYYCRAMHSDKLLTIAYAVLGAVERRSLPLGSLSRATAYDPYI